MQEIRDPAPGGFKRWLEQKRAEEQAPKEETMPTDDMIAARARTGKLLEAMQADPAREWTAPEAAEILGGEAGAASALLAFHARKGRIEKVSRGHYRWLGEDAATDGEAKPRRRATAARTARAAAAEPDLTRLRWLAEGYARGLTNSDSIIEEVLELYGLEAP